MAEENDDSAVATENMKLESGDIMMNVEPQGSEASDYKAIVTEDMKLETVEKMINAEALANEASDSKAVAPEDLKLETGDILMNVKRPANEASDNDMYLRKMEPGIVYEKGTEQLDEFSDSSFKEEGDCLRDNGDMKEDILVQNSPTIKPDIVTDQLRKKPALVIVGSNHKFNVRSRYLSDPVGSCHDFCKFGHKHESEKKTRRLTFGTIRESQPLTKDDPEKCVLEKMTKKKELHRRLSLPGTIPKKALSMHLEEMNPSKDINQSKMKHVQSERKPSLVQSPKTSSRSKTATQAVKKIVTQSPNLQKTSTQKLKEVKTWKKVGSYSKDGIEINENASVCSSSGTSLNKGAGYGQELKEIKAIKPMSNSPNTPLKAGYNKGVKEIKAKERMSNSPKTTLKKSPSLKARLYKNQKSSSNSRNRINPGEPKVDGHDDSIETNANMEPAEKTSKATNSGENSEHSLREARTRKPQGSKGNWKGTGTSLLSFSSRESSKLHGEQQGSEVTNNREIGFKTVESGSKTGTSREKSTATHRLKSLDFKNTKQNDIIQEASRSRTSTPREKSTLEQKWKPKRKEKSNVEENDTSAWKVKFKRGTVVAVQVTNNAPKRLRFRRARTLGEDKNAKSENHRQFKNDHDMSNEPHDKVGPVKVCLRHQEASEKKDDVDLNNVIEETASKLVKTRKSKVKALVGAFETVMSLGDRKRLVENGAS